MDPFIAECQHVAGTDLHSKQLMYVEAHDFISSGCSSKQ